MEDHLRIKVSDASLNVVTGEVRLLLEGHVSSALLIAEKQFVELNREPAGHSTEFVGHVNNFEELPAGGRLFLHVETRWQEYDVSFRQIPEPEHTSGVVLSICVPTYNRSARVMETVRNILKSELRNIEVIVCDNASTDDTVAQLRTIEDSRLKIYVNNRNWGPIRNFNLVLALGTGDYVLLHSDEDIIKTDTLDDFTKFLSEHPEVGAGLTSVTGSRTFKSSSILAGGREALTGIALGITYLGGFFYRRSLYNVADFFVSYNDPAFLYPFEAIAWKLARDASFCFYAPVVVERGRNDVSFFPRIDGRHFNHPVNLVAQYQMRCRYFERAATGYLDQADIAAAATKFRNMMLRQNFILCYGMPTDEMLELLQVLMRYAPETMENAIVRSLAFQLMGRLSDQMGENAAPWLKKATEADPQNSTAAFHLADVLRSNKEGEAETQLYTQIIENTPKRWAFLAKLIKPLQERKRDLELEQVKSLLLQDDMMTPDYIIKQFAG